MHQGAAEEHRRQLFPLPEQVTAFLDSIEMREEGRETREAEGRAAGGVIVTVPVRGGRVILRRNQSEPFELALRQFVQRRIGEPVPGIRGTTRSCPPHLRMNFRVVDEAGRELAVGRDLLALKGQLGQAAQLTFCKAEPGIEREGLRAWDFGDLPEEIAFTRGGRRLTGYPALVDEGERRDPPLRSRGRGGRCDARRRAAAAAHRAQGADASARERLAGFLQAALQLRTAVDADELREDLVNAIADRAFIGDDALPRTQKAFEAQRARARTRLPAVSEAASGCSRRSPRNTSGLARLASAQRPARATGRRHSRAALAARLQRLFQRDAVGAARATAALSQERCSCGWTSTATDPERDAKHTESIAQLTKRYDERVEKQRKAGVADPRLEEFRWHIEELRVSLFAQELKTPYPVSYKRLEKIWNAMR